MKTNQYFVYYKDNYNIYNLITKINKGYRLVFSQKYKYFAIINSAKNNEICLKFNSFSLNIVEKLLNSRIERNKIIFREIEEFNDKIKEKNIDNFKQYMTDYIKENYKLCTKV